MAWYRIDNESLVLIVRDFVASSVSISQLKTGDLLGDVEESHVTPVAIENEEITANFVSYYISEKEK
eukprot:CAMPEP_0194189886 /NCGR_PEP_ID=MMETSP0154-20130528/60730_1 /TAXON_ID=1049557 /ORGANISM="Thalassiothrix antarctica, Strain L6-D1" /LENGTH=66 /DNA_ID=CAMNT_0038911375 /DNA_START=553 /DNA_END=750 /DNA_ORIENTATION=-